MTSPATIKTEKILFQLNFPMRKTNKVLYFEDFTVQRKSGNDLTSFQDYLNALASNRKLLLSPLNRDVFTQNDATIFLYRGTKYLRID